MTEPADFLHLDQIEVCLFRYMDRGRWYGITELYELVERHAVLTDADWLPAAPRSASPRWKRNVRNWLQSRKTSGAIEWRNRAEYRVI
ncbi:hypothetical protein [Gaiella sp.]|uniref:hypothetical protein n=1 Tax=Gaiella sp. TaxID=2663207 RepID=UPI002E3429CA|nr:hypothetical protein [Gaiella sp.]HEX5585025.1 hypothetical protein [Gaiella sp.]